MAKKESKDQELIEVMEFDKIDKISDDVYNLGSNVVLRFNVTLSRRPPNQGRQSFHKEFEYINKEQERSVTIRRSFDFFLSLENIVKDSNGEKLFVRIGAQEFFLFKNALETAASWFSDSKYERLYAKDSRGKFRLQEPIPNIVIRDLPMQRSLRLIPTIVEKSISEQYTGVRIYYSNNAMGYVDMDLSKFMGLVYIVSTFNMYQNALSLVNYLGRPELGTHRFNLGELNGPGYGFGGSTYSDDNVGPPPTGINGRKIRMTIEEKLSDLEG